MDPVPFMKHYLQCQIISVDIPYIAGHKLVDGRFQERNSTFHDLPYFQRGSTAMLVFSS
jgi:hypothetical protein